MTNRERLCAETVPGDERDRRVSPPAHGMRGGVQRHRFLDSINGEGW